MHIIDWWSQIANQKPYPTSICHFAIRSYWGPFNPVSIQTPDYILSLSWQRIASTTPTLHRWISTTLICTKGFVRSSRLFVKSTAPLNFNGHCNWFLAKYRKLELGYIRLPTAKCPYHMFYWEGRVHQYAIHIFYWEERGGLRWKGWAEWRARGRERWKMWEGRRGLPWTWRRQNVQWVKTVEGANWKNKTTWFTCEVSVGTFLGGK